MDRPPTFSDFVSAVYGLWSDTVTGSRSASYVLLVAILGVVSILFAANLDQKLWLKVVIGALPTFLFFFFAFIYALFSLWRRQRLEIITLSEKLRPTLQLDFDQNSDGIVHTPIKVFAVDAHGNQTIIDSNGSYVRIRLTAISETSVRGCSAFVTKIQKRNASSGAFSEIRMPQSHRLTRTPVDVPQRVPQVIDFLSSGERENKLSLAGEVPLLLVDAFTDLTTYRLTILVVPENSPDQTITVEINWAGKWDSISGRKI